MAINVNAGSYGDNHNHLETNFPINLNRIVKV